MGFGMEWDEGGEEGGEYLLLSKDEEEEGGGESPEEGRPPPTESKLEVKGTFDAPVAAAASPVNHCWERVWMIPGRSSLNISLS